MDDSPNLEDQKKERELPRWVQIPAGIVLGSFTLLCGYASLVLLFGVNEKNPILAAVVGFVLLLGCLWVLEKCLRLLTGRKIQGGLLSPTALRVVSFFFLIFPIAGLFTGYYRRMGAVAVFQALMYLSSFFGLQALARRREANWVLRQGPKRRVKDLEAKRGRRLLEESVQTHLLPALTKLGFEAAPVAEYGGSADREFVRGFPQWGNLIRERESIIDKVEIQFSTYERAAFRINATPVPKEGMMTAAGHQTAEEIHASGLHCHFETHARPWLRPSLRAFGLEPLGEWFSVWHWPILPPTQADYDKLALHVAGILPELELALREGKLGPHVRRLEFKPLPPEVLERIRNLKAEREIEK
jgi:hypothetical protein